MLLKKRFARVKIGSFTLKSLTSNINLIVFICLFNFHKLLLELNYLISFPKRLKTLLQPTESKWSSYNNIRSYMCVYINIYITIMKHGCELPLNLTLRISFISYTNQNLMK